MRPARALRRSWPGPNKKSGGPWRGRRQQVAGECRDDVLAADLRADEDPAVERAVRLREPVAVTLAVVGRPEVVDSGVRIERTEGVARRLVAGLAAGMEVAAMARGRAAQANSVAGFALGVRAG
jgi:hypothetical protein